MSDDGPDTQAGMVSLEEGDFFDSSFLGELEQLANLDSPVGQGPQPVSSSLHEELAQVLAAPNAGPGTLLTEEQFIDLPAEVLNERTTALLDICRQGEAREAALSVESFIVFFQALVPTISDDGASQVRRVFFRLAPTLLHIAHNDFGPDAQSKLDGQHALRNLERILIEISSVRLAPTESELVFRSIDQLSSFISVAEYAMANEIISEQLLSIIERNKLTRSLYRLMEVEVQIQRYLQEKLGQRTPQISIPEDLEHLAAYGPIRVLRETALDGSAQLFLQVQLPDIPILNQIVLHLAHEETGQTRELRLDALGSVELSVPDGTYSLGLVYDPAEPQV